MTVAEQLSALSTILAQRSIHSLFQPIMCLSEQGCLAGGDGLCPTLMCVTPV